MSRVESEKLHVDGSDTNAMARAIRLLQTFTLEQDVRTVSTTTVLDPEDDLVLVDATAGTITITLPDIDDAQRKAYIVKKSDSGGNAVTVQGATGETIEGGTKTLSSQYSYVKVVPQRETDVASPIRLWWVA